jgi:hypothetical protein
MAILFFNLNRGGGGGSGGIMTLDNGLTVNVPGNGQLGGNLLHTTIINLNGEILEINGAPGAATTFTATDTTVSQEDGTDQSFVQVVATAATIRSFVTATNVAGQVLVTPGQVVVSGNDALGTTFTQITTNQVETDILAVDPATGRGEALVTAGDVHLTVQDIPGIANAGVDIQQDRVVSTAVNTGIGTSTQFLHPDETKTSIVDSGGLFSASIDLFPGEADLVAEDNTSLNQGKVSLTPGSALVTGVDGGSGNEKTIHADIASTLGIEVIDNVDNIGMNGNVVFPLSGQDEQYLQAGNVLEFGKGSNDILNQSTSELNLVNFTNPTRDGIYSINAYALWRSGIGSVAVTVSYTDVLGNPQTDSISGANPCSAANVATSYPPVVIKAEAGSLISISWTLTGVMTYDAGGVIVLLANV